MAQRRQVHEGHLVDCACVEGAALGLAGLQVSHADRAVRGDEGVLDLDRPAAGAAHAGGEPVVDHFDFAGRDQEEVGQGRPLGTLQRIAHDDPLGEVDAAAEAAFATHQPIATIDLCRRAAQPIDGGRQCARVGQHVALGLQREQVEHPAVPRQHAEDPARGAAGRAQLGGDLDQ